MGKLEKEFLQLVHSVAKALKVVQKAEHVSNLTLNKHNVLKSVNEGGEVNLQNSIQDL
jgi:hypothetical protein